MVASDPAFGINLPPEKVIGVNLMLQKPSGDVTVGALNDNRIHRSGVLPWFRAHELGYGGISFAPLTWYAGKLAAIKND